MRYQTARRSGWLWRKLRGAKSQSSRGQGYIFPDIPSSREMTPFHTMGLFWFESLSQSSPDMRINFFAPSIRAP
jgi:hypothetical protein